MKHVEILTGGTHWYVEILTGGIHWYVEVLTGGTQWYVEILTGGTLWYVHCIWIRSDYFSHIGRDLMTATSKVNVFNRDGTALDRQVTASRRRHL
jgi:tRNA A37 N6-isopentenylltransferase MiaA